jgi:cobalt/nickel transport system permease protein
VQKTSPEITSHGHHHGHDVGERLYIHKHSLVHSLASHLKILAVLSFILVVVSTKITNWVAFFAYFLLILGAALVAKINLITVFKRALIEIPFVFFAVLMPFFGTGKTVMIGPLKLYESGLLAGASIVAKGTLGVLSAVLLSTTTTAREILRGLERLKLPMVMVQIATFMLRYVNVISDEMERMKAARESRGFEATGVKHWKVLATAAGALFIRSYERGERVHLSMLSRGYEGQLPHEESKHNDVKSWFTALSLPIFAALILITTNTLLTSIGR